jgi:hypothetical protein
MTSMRDGARYGDKYSLLTVLLLVVVVLWCVVWFVHSFGYWEDDAWIHLEFARSLAAGRGFNFNGLVVYGDTSPLWVWLLDVFHAILPGNILPDPYATAGWFSTGKMLTAVGCIFALGGAWIFARTLTCPLPCRQSRLFAAVSLAIFVTTPFFGYWAFSGMEALTAAGLVCWGLAFVIPTVITPARLLLAALAAGLAPLLRPEMSFFSLLLAALLLVRWWHMPGSGVVKPLLLIAGLAIAVLPCAFWAHYALRAFGSVVPTTNAAKRAGPGDWIIPHVVGVYSLGFPLLLPGLLLVAAWVARALASGRRSAVTALGPLLGAGGWLIFVWSAVNAAFYVLNHTYVQTRYLYVTAPVLTTALLALVVLTWPRVYPVAAGCALMTGVVFSLLMSWPLIRNKAVGCIVTARFAAFLQTLAPEDAVADYSIGQVAFLSQHTIIDTGGITRPAFNAFALDKTDDRRFAWMRSQGARYIASSRPDIPGTQLIYHLDGVPGVGWHLNPRSYEQTGALELWTLPLAPAPR